MTKWEYAAIWQDKGVWFLIQPGEKNVFKSILPKGMYPKQNLSWRTKTMVGWMNPMSVRETCKAATIWNKKNKTGYKVDEKGIPLIHAEAEDIMILVNMAGAKGWEITGGLGFADGRPETRWRMMRREL